MFKLHIYTPDYDMKRAIFMQKLTFYNTYPKRIKKKNGIFSPLLNLLQNVTPLGKFIKTHMGNIFYVTILVA